VSTTKGVT